MGNIRLIAQKRFYLNLLSIKNVIAFLFVIGFCVTSFLISLASYKNRVALYNLSRNATQAYTDSALINTYSEVKLGIEEEPEKLGMFSKGVGEKFGSSATIYGIYGPNIIRSRDEQNFFLSDQSFDTMYFIGIFISLLAILMTYDVVSGEKENGTLSLALSNSVKKHEVILGELGAATFTLLFPIMLSLIITDIIAEIMVGLDGADIAGLIFFLLLSILLSIIFSLVGIFSSVICRSSLMSLLMAFLIWISFVVVLPNTFTWVTKYMDYVMPLVDLNSTDIVTFNSPNFLLPKYKNNHNPSNKEKENNLKLRLQQVALENQLKLFSPFSSYNQGSQIIAGTDIESHKVFLDNVKRIEDQFIAWQRKMVMGYPQRVSFYKANWGPLDLEGIPSATYLRESLTIRIRRALPFILSMCIFCIFLFSLAFVFFVQHDPRPYT